MPNAFPFAAFVSARVRLKVVASLKVTPSVEFADVCNTSFGKMSSLGLSAIESLLRMAVALPVSVATFPIGSSAAAGAGEGAAAGAGACAGWVCASFVRPDVAPTLSRACPTSMGEGIAKTFAPPNTRQPRSQSANESRYRVTREPDQGMETKMTILIEEGGRLNGS